VVCIREVQESIKDSVKTLIEAKIQKLGLGAFFDVLETEIRGPHGSLIIFRGMQSYNAENIKSLEAFDIAWVEEAQTLSDISWRLLRPTIRKEGSEIWCSWNPRHDTDAVDKFFRGQHKNPDAVCVEINWPDNPWFPDVLRREKDADYASDPEMADHVWGGNYQIVSEGAYYARLIVQAEREGRIGKFPYDPRFPVRTSWDIGVDDESSVWFWQDDGVIPWVVDYYEVSGDGAEDIVATALPELFIPPPLNEKFIGWSREVALKQLDRDQPFRYSEHLLPHDVKVREWGAGARTRIETLIALGLKNVRKGAANGPEERINASRRILPYVRFNDTPRVQAGIKRLRRYRRKYNDTLNTYTTPEKDGNDHGADAFGEFAVNCEISLPKTLPKPKPNQVVFEARPDGTVTSNMSIREIIEMRKRKRDAE
jgi:phage terminase large subunit